MLMKVLGWIAVLGSLGCGIGIIVTHTSSLYLRVGIICPLVLLWGLYEITRRRIKEPT